jgi:hypothetical protein
VVEVLHPGLDVLGVHLLPTIRPGGDLHPERVSFPDERRNIHTHCFFSQIESTMINIPEIIAATRTSKIKSPIKIQKTI